MLGFYQEPYQATIEEPTILGSPAEEIWEKFEYFDRMSHEYPNCDKYEEMKRELLGLWWGQFQKEYEMQAPIFKKGGKE